MKLELDLTCPHCGNLLKYLPDNQSAFGTEIVYCGDAADGGCDWKFAVSWTVPPARVQTFVLTPRTFEAGREHPAHIGQEQAE